MLTHQPSTAPKAIAVNLVLFFGFALAALVLLTHTIVDISRVRAAVADSVQPETRGIQADTALLPELAHISGLTAQLASASHGVNDSLTDVAGATRNIDATIQRVQSETQTIRQSVHGIAGSAASVDERVAALDSDITAIDDSATQVSANYAAVSHAAATLPDDLVAAAAELRSLARLIPSITQQASSIEKTLSEVDGHLVSINANGLIRLSNLLKVSNLLVVSASTEDNR